MIKPYQYKPGSKKSGNAWSSIAEDLNKISEVHFDINQEGVIDRCHNLIKKQKKKVRKEEWKSGFNEEDTELDNLLQNITEEWDEASASHDDQSKEKLKKSG